MKKILDTIDSNKFILISGPCLIEGEEMAFKIADKLFAITQKLELPFIFKGSFKKANRSRLDSFTGIGDQKALDILLRISKKYKIPTITDVHSIEDVKLAEKYVDVLQIPAFLCRQTDLIVAAARTGKIINIKKGQFLSPGSMKHAVNKVLSSGNSNVLITDRGTMFGYQDLIVDFKGIPQLQQISKTILDVTHSLQKPNLESGVTGGQPELIETIAKAGIAVGVDGIFMETHHNPQSAKSDGANMMPLNKVEDLLKILCRIRQAI